MECPSCGNTVREGSQFCPSCGGRVAVSVPSGTDRHKPLPPLSPAPPSVAVAGEKGSPGGLLRDRRVLVGGGIVTAVLVVLLAVLLLPDGDDGDAAVATTTVPPSTDRTLAPATTAPAEALPTGTTGPAESATPVDREDEALQELERLVAADEERVDSQMLDRWIPQVSSKRLGLEADGIVYDYAAILDHFTGLEESLGDLMIINSADYPSFELQGWYVGLAAESFGSSDGALGWCASHGMADRNRCFAKLVSRTTPYNPGTTEYPG